MDSKLHLFLVSFFFLVEQSVHILIYVFKNLIGDNLTFRLLYTDSFVIKTTNTLKGNEQIFCIVDLTMRLQIRSIIFAFRTYQTYEVKKY